MLRHRPLKANSILKSQIVTSRFVSQKVHPIHPPQLLWLIADSSQARIHHLLKSNPIAVLPILLIRFIVQQVL